MDLYYSELLTQFTMINFHCAGDVTFFAFLALLALFPVCLPSTLALYTRLLPSSQLTAFTLVL